MRTRAKGERVWAGSGFEAPAWVENIYVGAEDRRVPVGGNNVDEHPLVLRDPAPRRESDVCRGGSEQCR
jgi:hypothetical protein